MRALKINTADAFIINENEVELETPLRPVYVVSLPMFQVAVGVMAGIIMASVVVGFVAFLIIAISQNN